MSLKSNVLSTTKWSVVERIGSQGVQFLILVFLARLLLPGQFGLIAMIVIFFAIDFLGVESPYTDFPWENRT